MESTLKYPEVIARSRIELGKHSNTSYIEIFAHSGTHIDAPWHFNESGRKITDFQISEFVFTKVLLVNTPPDMTTPIPLEFLMSYGSNLDDADALLIRSGFAKHRETNPEKYVRETPGLSERAAQYLAGFSNLRCIGVDFISIENVSKGRETGFPVHHALLDREEPIILLEDANFFPIMNRKIIRLYLFPLRILGIEASPVTAVAEI